LPKVEHIAEAVQRRGLKTRIEVDGGIKPENARDAAEAGASVLVAGSAVYLDPDGVAAALAKFRKAVS